MEYEDRGDVETCYKCVTEFFNLKYIFSSTIIAASECVDMEVNCVEKETDSFSKCVDEINELGRLIGMERKLDELDHGKRFYYVILFS